MIHNRLDVASRGGATEHIQAYSNTMVFGKFFCLIFSFNHKYSAPDYPLHKPLKYKLKRHFSNVFRKNVYTKKQQKGNCDLQAKS